MLHICSTGRIEDMVLSTLNQQRAECGRNMQRLTGDGEVQT